MNATTSLARRLLTRGAPATLAALFLLGGCAAMSQVEQDKQTFKRAVALQKAGDDQGALTLYSTLSPADQGYTSALNNMALLHSRQGRPDAAEGLLRQALEVEPDSVITLTNLGLLHFRQGRRAEAIQALRKVAPARQRLLARAATGGRPGWDVARVDRETARSHKIAARALERIVAPVGGDRQVAGR